MSQRNSNYERKDRDFYETPEWVTEALLPHIPLESGSRVWECAAGRGKIGRVLLRKFSVAMTDIEPNAAWGIERKDFIRSPDALANWVPTGIFTNPPYEHAAEFCRIALEHMRHVDGVVGMLFKTDFDHAKTRSDLFGRCPAFAKKIVLTKRIVWFEPPHGAKGKGPSENHAWFIWDWKHKGPPTIAYAPVATDPPPLWAQETEIAA